jgi:2-dehydropantoate 2-reductase
MSKLTYAIIGTGALGGFYGARLQQAGSEVHFLLNNDYSHVSQYGLIIQSIDGDFHLPSVNAYNDVTKMPKTDVVILALKTTQNHLLAKLLPPIIKENGVVLVLQNGLAIEENIATNITANIAANITANSGNPRIIGGVCFLCSNRVAPGHIQHVDYKKIILGEYASDYQAVGITDRMQQIADDFENADIPIELAEDLLLARWKKLVWNIPYNGLSVILNASTNEIMENSDSRKLVENIMYEVLAGAKSCNRIIPDDYVSYMLDYTNKMKPYRTSMKIDYDEGRPLEIEAIFGNTLNKAKSMGVDLPLIESLYQQLKFLDDKNRLSINSL